MYILSSYDYLRVCSGGELMEIIGKGAKESLLEIIRIQMLIELNSKDQT